MDLHIDDIFYELGGGGDILDIMQGRSRMGGAVGLLLACFAYPCP